MEGDLLINCISLIFPEMRKSKMINDFFQVLVKAFEVLCDRHDRFMRAEVYISFE